MVVTVEIDEETESLLEELRAEIRRQTGTKLSQEELLERLVEEAYASPSDYVSLFRSSDVPLTEREKAVMREGQFRSGVETGVDVDDVLYR